MTDRVYARRFSEHPTFWGGMGIIVVLIYFYIYLKLGEAFPDGKPGVVWLLFCCAMTGLSYLARRSRRVRNAALRRWIDRIGSLWLLFVLYSFIFMAIFAFFGSNISVGPATRFMATVPLMMSFALTLWGIQQAYTVSATHLTIPTDKLPEGETRLRIVQMTDLHLGPYTGIGLLSSILRRVREAEPDMVVVTGDVADGRLDGRGREIGMFRRIRPKYGFYAVTGNHDYYDDIVKAVDFMERCGMQMLCNEAVKSGGICVIGVDDPAHLQDDKWGLTKSETVIVNAHSRYPGLFKLLLRHRPVVELGTEGMFDLQLSGHTHGGQIFPLITSRLFIAGHSRGPKRLKQGSMLYTSNGAGYVGPPARIFAPAEIVVIDLVKAKNKENV